MRLIDADALKKDDELTEWITRDTIRTGKMLKAFSELFVKKIDDAPTVNAVSEEVYTREYNLRKDAEFKAYKLEKALEQEPKWIPVSERLPEDDDLYLITFDNGEIDLVAFDRGDFSYSGVIAWMPLPQPYEPKGVNE